MESAPLLVWFWALSSVMLLTVTPPEMRGRVMGIYLTTFALSALGAFPMGALSDLWSAPLAVGLFGALTLLSVVIMLALRRGIARQ